MLKSDGFLRPFPSVPPPQEGQLGVPWAPFWDPKAGLSRPSPSWTAIPLFPHLFSPWLRARVGSVPALTQPGFHQCVMKEQALWLRPSQDSGKPSLLSPCCRGGACSPVPGPQPQALGSPHCGLFTGQWAISVLPGQLEKLLCCEGKTGLLHLPTEVGAPGSQTHLHVSMPSSRKPAPAH